MAHRRGPHEQLRPLLACRPVGRCRTFRFSGWVQLSERDRAHQRAGHTPGAHHRLVRRLLAPSSRDCRQSNSQQGRYRSGTNLIDKNHCSGVLSTRKINCPRVCQIVQLIVGSRGVTRKGPESLPKTPAGVVGACQGPTSSVPAGPACLGPFQLPYGRCFVGRHVPVKTEI